jgi:acyl carrier protein
MIDSQKQKNETSAVAQEIPVEELKKQLKALIVEALVLEDITPADIDSDDQLFGGGLGLDSIDALELAIAIERRYGVKFRDKDEENRKIFASVTSLANHISSAMSTNPRRDV